MPNSVVHLPTPFNEPVRSYAPGSAEKESLKKRLNELLAEQIEIPLVIGGREVRTGNTATAVCPHDHQHVLATWHMAGAAEVEQAIAAAKQGWREWSEMAYEDRAAIFLKAAELLAGPCRDTVNAACMLNQSKTVFQAEIDSACELIDFWRHNPWFMGQLYAEQPISTGGALNKVDYRPLEGFVFAVTPFNFASIAGNLPTAPAMMGNTVLWKPASSAVYTAWRIFEVLMAAGLPPGVINFVPGRGSQVGNPVMASPDLAGIHFTGSAEVFNGMWRTIGEGAGRYRVYPRVVGETGGKDFIFAHPSADVPSLVTALTRGAFEYQGQKCSAASRAYVPSSLWDQVRAGMEEQADRMKMGSPLDFRNFLCAMIDEDAFDTAMGYIEHARSSSDYEFVLGGEGDKSEGYFVKPTVIRTTDPKGKLISEEIFAPILTVFVYDDAKLDEALTLCDTTSPYGLTGAIFATDRIAAVKMTKRLRHAAGNFYLNDKPTGAVVNQQPFGGARASGTNDKAGSKQNLLRWASVRTVKENFIPPTDFPYPHMAEE